MAKKVVRFNRKDKPEFHKELKNRVNNYFKSNNISKHANFNMVFKTVFMICLYLVPFYFILFSETMSTPLLLLSYAIMGLGMAGIGLTIMHDAIHESYSRNKYVNFALGYLIHIIGGSKSNWKIQHNVLHHSFTNINDYDEDIDNSLMRFTPATERKPHHKYQAFYAPFLYGLMTVQWALLKDFFQLVGYNKNGLVENNKLNYKSLLVELIINKAAYFTIFLALPLIITGFAWWQILIGFFVMHFVCGLTLALIFQSAHVLEETEFFDVDEKQSVENNWAIHQLKTTANFSQNNRLFSWLVGGLNFQVEHHLFPNICHVHYRNLSPIIKETAEEYGIPYHSHHSFFDALGSHFRLLNDLGTGEYDRKQEAEKAKEKVNLETELVAS